ncbi:YhjD/YihY/BrkB family envelope integrity protein [Cyanobium sp. ATX-6F1]|uniref:YhjD/YihY/BrkB family envelope integrity protein n=1 Tax=Cyanobium sp. ATX-6F1 TaxID=3137388 RepID=UPI0039BDC097
MDCVDLSAAFAYHSLQSVFPVLLIALSLAAKLLGRDEGLVERLLNIVFTVLPSTAIPVLKQRYRLFAPGRGCWAVGCGGAGVNRQQCLSHASTGGGSPLVGSLRWV